MSMSNKTLTDRGKRPLTRADVEARLQQAGSSRHLDLAGEEITKSDLSHLDLSGANLSEANLSEANLSGAILIGANLSGATLTGADFSEAILIGATLTGAVGADFSGAILASTKLSYPILTSATLNAIRTDLSHAMFDQVRSSTVPSAKEAAPSRRISDAQKTGASAALRIRVKEEPRGATHLAETLEAFISLSVKLWLLGQGRFDDVLGYTEGKDRRFEEEALLLMEARNETAPAPITLELDGTPPSLGEALHLLVELMAWRRQRGQVAIMDRSQERMNVLETAERIVEQIAPERDERQKELARDSILADLRTLTQDLTLEIESGAREG